MHPLAETWAISARITQYLLDGIPDDALAISLSGHKRTVRDLFAHVHDVRLLWLSSARADLLERLTKIGSGSSADRATLTRALAGSATAIGKLVTDAAEGEGRVKGFKPHVTAFAGYLVAHEAHHRGQVALALRAAGHPLDKKVSYGMWEWGVR